MRGKIKFFHTASGNQECSHLKKKKKISFLDGNLLLLKRQCLHSTATQQYFVAYLVLKTKCEKPQLPSCLSPSLHVTDTWYSERPEQRITKWSWRGLSLQDMFSSPEINYSYLVRESTSDNLYKLQIPFFSQVVENQIYYPQGQFL